MVIFGGLELVAAGYLLHEHTKHKEERARLEEEEAAHERRRRHRHHSADQRRHHSRDRKHSYDSPKPPQESRPQYVAPAPYPASSPYLAPPAQPARANSAPPPRHDAYYPPTGWPAEWEQTHRPEPNRDPGPLPTKYGWRPEQEHVDSDPHHDTRYSTSRPSDPSRRRSDRSRGRSETRPADSPAQMSASRPVMYNTQSIPSPHVRFALPNDRPDPPPAYRA